jgi:uncharacterized membrane protein
MKKLTYYLIQGILLVGPLAFTMYILYVMFTYTDELLRSFMAGTIGWQIPGMGILLVLLLLILVGFVGQTIIARPFKAILKYIIRRIPILELIYQSFEDFLNAIFGEKRKFNKPVVVKMYEHTDLEKIGFITAQDLSAFGESGKVAVYFPFCYSIAGEVYIVPSDRVKILPLSTAEVMKFVVSGGVAEIGTGRQRLKKSN